MATKHKSKVEAEQVWSDFLDDLIDALNERAKKVKSSPIYWRQLDYEAGLFCYRHVGKRPDGGDTSIEEDGQRFCDRCHKILDHSFTDYGKEWEIQCSSQAEIIAQPVSPEEAFTLVNVIGCGWPRLTERDYRIDLRADLCFIAERLGMKDIPSS